MRIVLSLLLLSAAANAEPLPADLVVKTLDGVDYKLSAQKGQWVVVNYWATWCGPCIKEMPELDELDKARDDVGVIGLAFEDTSAADLKKFLEKRPVSYPIAQIDVYAPPATFKVPKGLPTTHLISPDGELAKSFLGPVTRADLEAAIAAAK